MSEPMDPNTQSASSSAETNLTWTTTDQEMLDDLIRQGETITEIVTHSQGLEDPTRLVTDASSLEDSTLSLKSDIMSSGNAWRDRTTAFINRLPALSPALVREMARQTQVATTNSPEQSMETELRFYAERCHTAVVVLRDKCSEYKASNTAVSDTRLGKELDEYFCSITNLQRSLRTVATSWIGEFLPRAARTSVPE
ncbi:hypothetical protein EHS25_006076 [Saitozyma podzolica]|uniref:Uncharacterized protein n=1 Tax=Saitozyma podzolica TaxID=1890683 RepID=A0A427XTJ3_9TREE|nr:hypothetical protein EHS25_006076 [Saitozyma podzolica]